MVFVIHSAHVNDRFSSLFYVGKKDDILSSRFFEFATSNILMKKLEQRKINLKFGPQKPIEKFIQISMVRNSNWAFFLIWFLITSNYAL